MDVRRRVPPWTVREADTPGINPGGPSQISTGIQPRSEVVCSSAYNHQGHDSPAVVSEEWKLIFSCSISVSPLDRA